MQRMLVKGLLFAGAMIVAPFLMPTSEAQACVSITQNRGNSVVYNGCSYPVIGNYRGSDGSWGGYGRINPGQQEGISMRRGSSWRVSFCNYELWQNGKCRPEKL